MGPDFRLARRYRDALRSRRCSALRLGAALDATGPMGALDFAAKGSAETAWTNSVRPATARQRSGSLPGNFHGAAARYPEIGGYRPTPVAA
jgi:hypothetical protein